jgi:hypothetical protein
VHVWARLRCSAASVGKMHPRLRRHTLGRRGPTGLLRFAARISSAEAYRRNARRCIVHLVPACILAPGSSTSAPDTPEKASCHGRPLLRDAPDGAANSPALPSLTNTRPEQTWCCGRAYADAKRTAGFPVSVSKAVVPLTAKSRQSDLRPFPLLNLVSLLRRNGRSEALPAQAWDRGYQASRLAGSSGPCMDRRCGCRCRSRRMTCRAPRRGPSSSGD